MSTKIVANIFCKAPSTTDVKTVVNRFCNSFIIEGNTYQPSQKTLFARRPILTFFTMLGSVLPSPIRFSLNLLVILIIDSFKIWSVISSGWATWAVIPSCSYCCSLCSTGRATPSGCTYYTCCSCCACWALMLLRTVVSMNGCSGWVNVLVDNKSAPLLS